MRLFELDLPRLFLVGLTVVMLVSVGIAASTSSSSFGGYNPTWEGTSTLRQEASAVGAEPIIATSTDDYERVRPESSIAVLLSPDRPYSPAETNRVRQFVRAGGTLVVAEDFGRHTNPLLADLGVRTRVDGRLLRDERWNYQSPDIVVAPNITPSTLTGGTNQITLNHGSVLHPNGSRVLANSSSFSYIDTNRNGSLDGDEVMDRYPVATVENVGQGRVVVVSDPSLFINAMVNRPGNGRFVRALLSGHETVLLDYSHTSDIPPLIAATLAVRESQVLRGLVGLVGIGAVALAKRRYG